MRHYYTNERNHQILIALLKAHEIRYIVASPGVCNSVFVGSVQNDDYFHVISSVDERSAAYIACGLAMETGEPVVISCTGATAARNYMPGATEAYYSKLPILILTSSQPNNRIGHLFPQVTDRTCPPSDVCRVSMTLPNVRANEDEWECEVVANKALTELRRHGGGPVHLNMITTYSYNDETALTCQELPSTRVIRWIGQGQSMPELKQGKIAVFVGSHKPFSQELTRSLDHFCETNNSVVLTDHTSNYNGRYKIPFALAINQSPLNKTNTPAYQPDLLIHIGEVSGEEGAMRMIRSKETWRVSEDGEMRDTFRNMTNVFEMPEQVFFDAYSQSGTKETSYYSACMETYVLLKAQLPVQNEKMPFSNVWVAQQVAPRIPSESTVTLSILNTLRTWNYAEFKDSVKVYSPVGGFGIDGATSMLLGASLADEKRPCFCITGDLAFFYDLNALGNRHITDNLRILLVNNGLGFEFRKSYSMGYRLLGDEVNKYVAAEGHFGNQSLSFVRHMAEDLGFSYLSASNKEELLSVVDTFTSSKSDRPMLLEVFVSAEDESEALNIIHNRN